MIGRWSEIRRRLSRLIVNYHERLTPTWGGIFRPGADKMVVVNERAEIFFSDHETKPSEDFGSEYFRPEIDSGPVRNMLLESLQPGTVLWSKKLNISLTFVPG